MMWDGPRNDQDTRIWYPFERGAAPSVSSTATCGNLGSQCWAHADTSFDWHPLPLSQFDDETQLATQLVAPYSDITSTALDAVKNRGAKILMYHGGADPLIPHRQSIHYYNETLDRFGGLDAVKPWFRFFVAPGMGHCAAASGRSRRACSSGWSSGSRRASRRTASSPPTSATASSRAAARCAPGRRPPLQRHRRSERCGELHLRRQRRDAQRVVSRYRRSLPE
jgi:feruloyl esterase